MAQLPGPIPAVILAGGAGRRMGGADKALLPFRAATLLDAVLARLPEAAPRAIAAGGDPERFARFGLPVLPDPVPGRAGPLAGLLAALHWAGSLGAGAVLTLPCDTPFLPGDLLDRLGRAGPPALAATGGGTGDATGGGTGDAAAPRLHPVTGLWPVGAAAALGAYLEGGGRRVGEFASAIGARPVLFPPLAGGADPFANLNTPEDLSAAEAWPDMPAPR